MMCWSIAWSQVFPNEAAEHSLNDDRTRSRAFVAFRPHLLVGCLVSTPRHSFGALRLCQVESTSRFVWQVSVADPERNRRSCGRGDAVAGERFGFCRAPLLVQRRSAAAREPRRSTCRSPTAVLILRYAQDSTTLRTRLRSRLDCAQDSTTAQDSAALRTRLRSGLDYAQDSTALRTRLPLRTRLRSGH
jgi:hypothetical protein